MTDVNARDAKLIQYLNEAYGKERQLQTALEAHIQMTTRAPYKKRLQEHLRETKTHAQAVERRIKQLGGSAEAIPVPGPGALGDVANRGRSTVQRAAELARGSLHAIRGTSDSEKMLKNAKTEFSEEHEEIANYTAIEVLANNLGDKETARVARDIRRQEERMASFLERLIPQLTTAVVKEEIPVELRNGSRTRRRSTSRTRRTARSRSRSTARGSTSARSRSRSSSSRSGSSSRSRASGSTSRSRRSASGSSGTRRATSRRSGSSASSSRRSGSARSTSRRTASGRSSASRSGSARAAGASRRRSTSAARSVTRSGTQAPPSRAAAPPAAEAARTSGDTGTQSTGS